MATLRRLYIFCSTLPQIKQHFFFHCKGNDKTNWPPFWHSPQIKFMMSNLLFRLLIVLCNSSYFCIWLKDSPVWSTIISENCKIWLLHTLQQQTQPTGRQKCSYITQQTWDPVNAHLSFFPLTQVLVAIVMFRFKIFGLNCHQKLVSPYQQK